MSRKFDDFLNEQLNDAEIRSEYEALQPEHDLIQDMIDAGEELHEAISEKQKDRMIQEAKIGKVLISIVNL